MRNRLVITLIFLVAMTVSVQADTVVTGYLADADHVNLHTFNVSNGGVVTFNFVGNFDANFSLFNATGNHLISNDDSPDGQTSPQFSQLLGPGSYTLAVTVCCNFANALNEPNVIYTGDDGFGHTAPWFGLAGAGNLADGYTNYGCQDAGPLCNVGGDYEVIVTSSENTTVAAVPEPTSLLLLGTGFVGLAGKLRKRA